MSPVESLDQSIKSLDEVLAVLSAITTPAVPEPEFDHPSEVSAPEPGHPCPRGCRCWYCLEDERKLFDDAAMDDGYGVDF